MNNTVRVLVLFLVLLVLFSCKIEEYDSGLNDGLNNKESIEGNYFGYYERNGFKVNVVLNLFNGAFHGKSMVERLDNNIIGYYPAICEGSYEVADNVIKMTNNCDWTNIPDFSTNGINDSIVLKGEWQFSIENDTLKMNRTNRDKYVLCKKSKINTSCNFVTTIDEDAYREAGDRGIAIDELSISNDCLNIIYWGSGCSGGTWELELLDSDAVLESSPPKRRLKLILKFRELCAAVLSKEATFDISELKVDGENEIELEIVNADKSIIYNY